ncbi:hypothetical protein ABW19_dt0202010 [Dactylella cylindrospora]|nr:hypothetical protein ABW19_dt0202010 [Dactylella cylindrospora]
MRNNYWKYPSSKPGIPTIWCINSSAAIRVLWALEELIEHGKLEKYNVKAFKRKMGRAPEEMKEGFRLGKSPILTVSPASAPDDPPTPFVESRLILHFLAEHYSDGIWEQPTPEDRARNTFFEDFACVTLQNVANMTLGMDIVPQAAPWPIKPIFMLFFLPMAWVMRQGFPVNFELMEDSLTDEKPWFSGTKLGLADFCMVFPMDIAAERGYFDASKYPKISEWHKTIRGFPSYKKAVAQCGSYNLKRFDI